MPIPAFNAEDEDAITHYKQALTFSTPPASTPVLAQWRAFQEVRPLGHMIDQLRIAVTPCPSDAGEVVAMFTGTPTGSKFLADDGTLKVPAGGSGTGNSWTPGGW